MHYRAAHRGAMLPMEVDDEHEKPKSKRTNQQLLLYLSLAINVMLGLGYAFTVITTADSFTRIQSECHSALHDRMTQSTQQIQDLQHEVESLREDANHHTSILEYISSVHLPVRTIATEQHRKLTVYHVIREFAFIAQKVPPKVEAEVRKQMAARKMKHEDENESRKLTPEEQKQKRDKKLFGGDGKQLYAAVYRIDDLSDPQHQYKVDINAKQNKLTGITAIVPSFALVFVEGGAKPMARYRRLMERRVKWNERSTPREGAEPQPQHNSDDEGKQNTCSLVWEGPILKKAFQSFRIEKFDSVAMGRAFFDKKNVPQYFEMCKNHKTAQED
eukprot:c9868_g1_i1.p2 GENE.c9868_g1_i1~~c9868_g1_i1.p2  ORF type:complete len:331 (+),score=93.72 c9868_g1_i1:36-1028(+)